MIDLVVARFNEDVGWVEQFKTHPLLRKTLVYEKQKQDSELSLPNIGREAHTYVHHIVANYDDLADYTVFVQGTPVDSHNWLLGPLPELLDFQQDQDFVPLTKTFVSDLDGSPNHPGLGLVRSPLMNYVQNLPTELRFPIGAQFAVKRDAIHYHDKQFYESLLSEFDSAAMLPWQIERVWPYIFQKSND